MKQSLANLAVHLVNEVVRIVKSRLKWMPCRPSLITAFTAETGLEP